jgi:hypothetical protein
MILILYSSKDGHISVAPKRSKTGYRSPETSMVLTWTQDYAELYGDKLPDRNGIHLPECITKIIQETPCVGY